MPAQEPSLGDVVTSLKSDKVKIRQEGLTLLRTAFARDYAVLNLDREGKGRAWLPVFEAIFQAVNAEKSAYLKKGATTSTVALRRLGDAAATARWLVERTVERMSWKVVKPVLIHLRQTMVHRGELFTPVALDYVKAIRCILGRTPHMDHLKENMWIDILELAFNVVLGDPVTKRLVGDLGTSKDDAEHTVSPVDDMDVELEEENGTPSVYSASPSKKRKRQSPVRKPQRTVNSPAPVSQPVTLEQIEFMSVIALLLRSSSTPLVSRDHLDLPECLFNRFARFIRAYSADTSLHHEYLVALIAALSHVALNRRAVVQRFARDCWDGLVNMWGTKNQRTKQDLVIVLRSLLPYLIEDCNDGGASIAPEYGNGIFKLWQLLSGEAENRWGIKGLSLDALRLEIAQTRGSDGQPDAFVAHTFRHGWHFDATQALAWAVLELQADCIEKLYHLSESVHGIEPNGIRAFSKRAKLENPVKSLMNAIRTQIAPVQRVYHLQMLLFYTDRHWHSLYEELQQEIVTVLLQFISFEDASVQSWIFLSLAAIAHASCLHPTTPADRETHASRMTSWDTVWTHAMRRINVPAACRAACHAASVLLFHSGSLLTSQRVLSEIETLARDIDVQGPIFPYDSVCAFLSMALRVANQDVRLYRMQLDEKALTWLTDTWRVEHGRRVKMPLHTSQDTLMLLEGICALSQKSNLLAPMPLPDCPIVDAISDHQQTAVIRDFLLRARLPQLRRTTSTESYSTTRTSDTPLDEASHYGRQDSEPADLVAPRARERRVSAFFLKSVEELIANWDLEKETTGHLTAEQIRVCLDMAVAALTFEAVLMLNGTRSNRRTIQAACRLCGLIFPLIPHKRWFAEERILILAGLQPILLTTNQGPDWAPWEALVLPSEDSGIRYQVLKSMTSARESLDERCARDRRRLQRHLFQIIDVQDVFGKLSAALRDILRHFADPRSGNGVHSRTLDVDENDGFGPVRTTQDTRQSAPTTSNSAVIDRSIVDICMWSLAVLPALQSASGEPTRDKELVELVVTCAEDQFFIIAPVFFEHVRQGTLRLSATNMQACLGRFEDLLKRYDYGRSERLHLLTVHFLHATMDLWLQCSIASSLVGYKVREIWAWFCGMLESDQVRSWRIRDYLTRFLDVYLMRDPDQAMWLIHAIRDKQYQDDGDDLDDGDVDTAAEENLPSKRLPALGTDSDIRVRFRAAVVSMRLLTLANTSGGDVDLVYEQIHDRLCTVLKDYEGVLTRLLCLGNVMIVSSAIRRGAYWHLLEMCLFEGSKPFTKHVECILRGVAERLGLSRFSDLFESYASQMAFSIRKLLKDLQTIPPRLLGYSDKRECAAAALSSFTPANLLADGSEAQRKHGWALFEGQCKLLGKTNAEGLRECFPEIAGIKIVRWMDEHMDNVQRLDGDLMRTLDDIKTQMGERDDLLVNLKQDADAIACTLLRTLGEQDFAYDGPIIDALRQSEYGQDAAQAFEQLSRFRNQDGFRFHTPNLPCYSTRTILESLRWFTSLIPDIPTLTYHILHIFFADLEQSPLINEQMRILNGICIWVAVHRTQFYERTLLRTFANMAAILLTQSDLARSAQSLLAWCFDIFCDVEHEEPRLADILIRASCSAHDYAQDKDDHTIASMGHDILQWLEDQILRLARNPRLRNQVAKALATWPQDVHSDLLEIRDELKTHDLSAVLRDRHISSNRFRIVRRIRDIMSERSGSSLEFMQEGFWLLKKCIPTASYLLDEDVDAFAGLLLSSFGRIHTFRVIEEDANNPNVRANHRIKLKKLGKEGTNGQDSSYLGRRAIVEGLLGMLDAATAGQLRVAYMTLRSVMSVLPGDMEDEKIWTREYRGDVKAFKIHPTPCTKRESRDLLQDLSSENFLTLAEQFPSWIQSITILLCDVLSTHDMFYRPLITILEGDVGFAEQILPVLVQIILQIERSEAAAAIDQLTTRKTLSTYFTAVLCYERTSVCTHNTIVDVALHLRYFQPQGNKNPLAYDHWLQLDYLLLSRSAIKCGAYTTALLFLELASNYVDGALDTAISERVLFEIYNHIDEPDGFYAIRTHDLRGFLFKRLHHEHQWDKAFRFHGAALEAQSATSLHSQGLVQSLRSFGFDSLAMTTLPKLASGMEGNATNAMLYELGWRTETWDLPDLPGDQATAPLYLALRAVYRERDSRAIDSVVRQTQIGELLKLRRLGDENLTEIRRTLQNVMCLSQVNHWRSPELQSNIRSRKLDDEEWQAFSHIARQFEFCDAEAIMAIRISLIRSAKQKEQREQIGELLSPLCQSLLSLETSCLISLAEAAREAGHNQIALNSIVRAQELDSVSSWRVTCEFANVLWSMNEPKLAAQSLDSLLSGAQPDISGATVLQKKGQTALMYARLGTWSAEASLEKPVDIIKNMFDPASSLLQEAKEHLSDSHRSLSEYATVFHQYAIFAERQYHTIVNSPDAIRWRLYVDRKKEEIKQRQEQINRTRDVNMQNTLKSQLYKARKILLQDEEQFKNHTRQRDSFLQVAVEMYSRCLHDSDFFDDDAVIRLCSLWLANFDSPEVQVDFSTAFDRIPSHKFVFLAHQLSARLSKTASQPTQSQEQLTRLMTRMCSEHPFHSLYQVFCLLDLDRPGGSRRASVQPVQSKASAHVERTAAAADIFDKLKSAPSRQRRVIEVEQVCSASLEWAVYPLKDKLKNPNISTQSQVPGHLLISRIRNLQVPVITIHTPIDPTTRYQDCIWIQSYETTFTTAGGVNLPKISRCIGSDGRKYKQLFKGEGNDDLRQDTVMEQVFDLVNIVLRQDRETKMRDLGIRRYRVIPLASQAGILEFVDNTEPLGQWLMPAHKRYYPESPDAQREHSGLHKKYQNGSLGLKEFLKDFLKLRDKFPPVMKHYFTEKRKDPMSWFAMRLKYARSVATTSIVGHILGLGDRHTSNILMDIHTGEVIHIDLGIAFEQGKLLPVPERVPFRLTPDMVDGLGTSSTQGVFQRCSEETLRVLRSQSEVILTVLEVFKFDPLHSWTASELKVKRVQGSTHNETTAQLTGDAFRQFIGLDMASGTAAEAADRALSAVRRKLDKTLSVEYTVNELIAEATDPENLAQMYSGWGPLL